MNSKYVLLGIFFLYSGSEWRRQKKTDRHSKGDTREKPETEPRQTIEGKGLTPQVWFKPLWTFYFHFCTSFVIKGLSLLDHLMIVMWCN